MSGLARTAKIFSILFLFIFSSCLFAAEYEQELAQLQKEWAIAKYQTPHNQQIPKFEHLIKEAEVLNQKYPNQPSIMVWYATCLSTYSAIKGGIGVLPYVKKAKALLEKAIQMDSNVENGFAHGVLGTLYARVPGWPVAFGSKEKARHELEIAIEMDPQGIDANYYYGDFLVDMGDYEEAKKHLEIAQHAPVRKDHEIADRGRKGEVAASMAKLRRLQR